MTLKSFLNWIHGMFLLPLYIVYDLFSGSVRVGWEILTPGSSLAPAFVEVPLRCRNSAEIAALANLVSLTPGSLAIAARHDPATLWVHSMYTKSHTSAVHYVHTIEDHLLRATRPKGVPPRPEDLHRDTEGRRR